MKKSLLAKFRKTFEQAFVPIFVKDEFDTETLLAGCELAGVSVMEYTLRRPDAHKVIPTLKNRYPDKVVYVGSTLDSEEIVAQMREKHPQLLSVGELAPFVDGFVSMLPYSNETLEKYRSTHLMIPTAETSGEALRQMSHGATVIKVCGPDFSFSKKLDAAPTFNYCPTFITGGVNHERMAEAYEAGNILTAAGFDLILKGEDPATLTPEKVAEKLSVYLAAAKEAREKAQPWTKGAAALSDEDFLAVFPHYCSVKEG
jgi:2-keto-3-deoxy-6-phosphogluconate aldolase